MKKAHTLVIATALIATGLGTYKLTETPPVKPQPAPAPVVKPVVTTPPAAPVVAPAPVVVPKTTTPVPTTPRTTTTPTTSSTTNGNTVTSEPGSR